MKRLFTDEEARQTVAAMYLPGIQKCLDVITELRDQFQSVVSGSIPTMEGAIKRLHKKPHWTQTPEGREKQRKAHLSGKQRATKECPECHKMFKPSGIGPHMAKMHGKKKGVATNA